MLIQMIVKLRRHNVFLFCFSNGLNKEVMWSLSEISEYRIPGFREPGTAVSSEKPTAVAC